MAETAKVTFARRCQETNTAIANAITEAADLRSIYFDRGYNSGGADQITDADLASALGIPASLIGDFSTMAEQLEKFRDNQAVTMGDYGNTLNNLRTL